MPTDMPLPNPWLMGLLMIGAGLVFWWLAPDIARREEESGRSGRDRLSLVPTWTQGRRTHSLVATRLDAVVCIALGVVLLVAAGGA
jgi:hypothetical protein